MMKVDAVSAYLARNRNISPEAADALRTLLGLDTDKSLWQQYLDYWALLPQGDLGAALTTLSFIGVVPPSNYNWGTILHWASAQGAFQQNQRWWYLPPALCIAALGVALSLLNFGIDEYVNPRLRSAGECARAMKKRGLDINDTVTQVRQLTETGKPS